MQGGKLARHGGRNAQARRLHTVLPQHGHVAVNDFQLLVLGQQLVDIGDRGAAIATGIVVKFNERDVRIGRAFPCIANRRFNELAIGLNHFAEFLRPQIFHRLWQDFRVGENVFPHDLFDRGTIRRVHGRGLWRRRRHVKRSAACANQPCQYRHYHCLKSPDHRRLRLPFSISARDAMAISCARIQSGDPLAIPPIAASALSRARLARPCRL